MAVDDASSIHLDIDGAIAVLRLNRPQRLNAFTTGMHVACRTALDQIESNRDLRVVIITGEGRGFCAGADLSERAEMLSRDGVVDLQLSLSENYNPLIRRLTALSIPVICAVNGIAAGAGVGLALAGDIVVAARSAQFQLSFAKVGLALDAGLSWAVPQLIGPARAMGLALTAEPISAETALAWGLIWAAVDDERLLSECMAFAARLALLPPTSLAAIKSQLRGRLPQSFEDALQREALLQGSLGKSEAYANAMRAFVR